MTKTQNLPQYLRTALKKIKLPQPNSHKGQNGKLLIVGGSELFHAASKWSLDIASKFVDMVFYASIPSNNELIKQAKQSFWNGIIIERSAIPAYIDEADCVLIGPGMERDTYTEKLTNELLKNHPTKKWVIDAGALQMVNPQLLTNSCIITPHAGEMEILKNKGLKDSTVTAILKGSIDQISFQQENYLISGGNAGMTKGGTGDVLAGLVAALYCTNDALTSCLVASHINKMAGEKLYQTVGPFFNASDLVNTIPKVMWQEIKLAAE